MFLSRDVERGGINQTFSSNCRDNCRKSCMSDRDKETDVWISGNRNTNKKKKADVPGLCVKCSVCVCMLIQANTHLNVISSVWARRDLLALGVWTVFPKIGQSIHSKHYYSKRTKRKSGSVLLRYVFSVPVCVCVREKSEWVRACVFVCTLTCTCLSRIWKKKREEAKLAWQPRTTFMLMQPLLDKLACQRNKKKEKREHKEHRGG